MDNNWLNVAIALEAKYDEGYEAGKRAIAEQIFEDIENALTKARKDNARYDLGYGYCVRLNIDELKKKYIGGRE